MSEDSNHINYSAADIEKYWNGQLSVAAQHAMEKAALEDPFLADAMEGYEASGKVALPAIAADNEILAKRLAARVAEKETAPVIKFSWWKIAAMVIVLAGAAWLYVYISPKQPNNGIAKNIEQAPPAPVIKTDTGAIPQTALSLDTAPDIALNKKQRPPEASSIGSAKNKVVVPATVPDAAPPESESLNREEATAGNADKTEEKKDAVASMRAAKQAAPKAASEMPEQKTQDIARDDYSTDNNKLAGRVAPNLFKGTVMDQSHKPVANVPVQIPTLNVATQTDSKGYFSFKASDSTLSVSIVSDGFETQNFSLRNKATLNQIVLTPAPANQRDVVTQSNGAQKKKAGPSNDISIKILDAEPIIGWERYNKYLESRKNINEASRTKHGSVIVSFEVHKGWLSDFEIEQSLDDELDETAIQLIKTGPGWKLLRGKKAGARVTVKF
ncbi:MAG: carboxypeptidase-like regulatory domain-containing protein [Chitinophagaceae bacterium]